MKMHEAGIVVQQPPPAATNPPASTGPRIDPPAGMQDAPFTWSGLGKAAVSGVRSGVEGIGGLGGDVNKGQRWLARKVMAMLGGDEAHQEQVANFVSGLNPLLAAMPSSEDVGKVTDAGVGLLPDSIASTVQDVTRHQPQNRAESWANTGGSLLPGAALPGGWMARLARVAIPTAAIEGTDIATDPLVRSGSLDPETQTALKIVAGVISGGGTGMMENAAAAKAAAAKVGSNPAALGELSQLLVDSGMKPEEAAAAVKQLGDGAVLPDVNDLALQKAQQIQAGGGPGRQVISDALKPREAAKGDRLGRDVTSAVGPEVQRTDVIKGLEARKKAIGKEYGPAHQGQTKPVETQPIIDQIDTELATVKSPKLRSTLQGIKDSLKLKDSGEVDPSSEGLHQARIAIDEQLYDANGKVKEGLGANEAGTLKHYRSMIDEALGDASPDVKAVDAKFHQVSKEDRAFKAGGDIYDKGKKVASPTEFQRTWDTMSEGEQAKALEGVNRETWRRLQDAGNDVVELKRMLVGKGKGKFQKLSTVIGQDKADALMQALTREQTFQNTYQKVIEGSRTAGSTPREPAGARFGGSDVADIANATWAGGPKGLVGAVTLKGLKAFGQHLLSRTKNPDPGLAKLLMSDNPDEVMAAVQELNGSGGHVMPNAALPALEQRKRRPLELTVTKGDRG